MELNLVKPIIFFDLETTGVIVGSAHVVEICMYRINVDHTDSTFLRRIRPTDADGNTIHIPEETTAIHGISDADVANEPTFVQIAPEILAFIGDSDLAGYNSNRFDIPLLVEEFLRAGIDFDVKGRNFIDVQNIFHKMEQRTLKAAYRFYCNSDLVNAHTALGDTMATYEVFKAQLDRYNNVEFTDNTGKTSVPVVNDMSALSEFTTLTQWADLAGHIGYDKKHREVFNFGKHKGKVVEEIFEQEPPYYDWMMKADFPLYTKKIITEIWERRDKRKLEALKLHFEGK